MEIKSKYLNCAVDEFVLELKEWLAEKERQGMKDWKNREKLRDGELINAIAEKAWELSCNKIVFDKDYLDIAAWCMFLWYRNRLAKERKERTYECRNL